MQTDPIGYEDGMNWYAYVGNDPVNGRDPTGEFGVIGFIAGFAADAAAQYIEKGSVDFRQSAVSGAAGALTGAVGAVYKTAGLITKTLVNTATNMTTSVAAGAINTELGGGEATLKGAVKDAAMSVAGISGTVKKAVGGAANAAKSMSKGIDIGVPSNSQIAANFTKEVVKETVSSIAGTSAQAGMKKHANELKKNK